MNARFSKIKGDEKARRSKDEVVLLTISFVDRVAMHNYTILINVKRIQNNWINTIKPTAVHSLILAINNFPHLK